jgi:hypothetical protein
MKINRLKMQFDERKRKLIISGAICSAKKTFFRYKFVTKLVRKKRTPTLLYHLKVKISTANSNSPF